MLSPDLLNCSYTVLKKLSDTNSPEDELVLNAACQIDIALSIIRNDPTIKLSYAEYGKLEIGKFKSAEIVSTSKMTFMRWLRRNGTKLVPKLADIADHILQRVVEEYCAELSIAVISVQGEDITKAYKYSNFQSCMTHSNRHVYTELYALNNNCYLYMVVPTSMKNKPVEDQAKNLKARALVFRTDKVDYFISKIYCQQPHVFKDQIYKVVAKDLGNVIDAETVSTAKMTVEYNKYFPYMDHFNKIFFLPDKNGKKQAKLVYTQDDSFIGEDAVAVSCRGIFFNLCKNCHRPLNQNKTTILMVYGEMYCSECARICDHCGEAYITESYYDSNICPTCSSEGDEDE